MANLTEKQTWETGIYQLETTDPVEGGAEGKSNQQAKQLANRTAWLRQQVTPTGSLITWPTATPPAGYLECDGAALSRTTYAALYAVLGVTYGKGAGALANTTFRVPDLRGEFIRGWDHGRGVDSGRTIGRHQADAFKSHHHAQARAGAYGAGGTEQLVYNQLGETVLQTRAAGGTETRPRNIAMMFAIKY